MANANFTCVLDAWNDGKVLYGRMHYYRSGSYYYQDSTFPDPTMNLGGVTYSDSAFGARVRSGISVGDVYTTTFSRTVGGSGNRTVTFSAGSGQRSDFAGSWSKTVYIPESYSPPTGLNVTIAEIYPRGAKFNVSISSYGNPSSASGRWIEAGIAGQNAWQSPSLRSAVVQNSTSAQITVNNNSTQTTTLTVQPNTQYYYGGYATNTQRSASVVKGQFVTTAEAPTVTLNSVTSTTATFNYTANADGGYYNKTIEYSVDNGATWQTGATITGGSAASGSFTVNNLLSGAEYMLMVRVSTTSGSTTGTSVSFQTEAIIQRNKCVYGSVSGTGTEQITDLYGGSNSGAQRVTKLYGSVSTTDTTVTGVISPRDGTVHSFNGSTFWNAVKDVVDASKTMDYLTVERAGGGYYMPALYYTDGSLDETYDGATFFTDLEMRSMGINTDPTEPATATITLTVETSTSSEAKLIHQGFGHLDYTPYGYITYYTDNTHTTAAVAPIRTQEELDGFANHSGGGNWSTTIDFGRVTVSTRGDHAIKMISFTNKTTILKPYFLWGANYLNGEIVLPSSLTRINMAFLYACDSPNITVNVGNLSANIGIETSSYPYFLSAGSSSYGSYTTGIKIAGAKRAAWMTKFPNMDTTPYRKLVDAGY